MPKTILYALAILVVLIVVWLVFAPPEYTDPREGGASDAFRAYREANLDAASRILIAKGKANPVELKKAGDSWVVGSAYSYPADTEKVEKLIKSMDSIDKGVARGSAPAAHEEYEVDAKKGALITAFGADGKELARLVVGKSVPGGGLGTTKVFTRFGDDPVTYVVESDIRSEAGIWGKEAESKNFLQKKVVSLGDDMEIQSVRLVRPDKQDLLVERKFREVSVEKPKGEVDGPGDGAENEGDAGETAAADPGAPPGTPDEKPETKKEEYFAVTSGNET
ncbi:MAG TPA: DUF4340 domain-containing protein, partial [Planctomycetota bacterium]|nr:DUF4340 domain-containing protein [Planctomycetota bacterium]